MSKKRVPFFFLFLVGIMGCAATHNSSDPQSFEEIHARLDKVIQDRADFRTEVESLKSDMAQFKGYIENDLKRSEALEKKLLQLVISVERRLEELEKNINQGSLSSRGKSHQKITPSNIYQKGKAEHKKKKYRQAILSFRLLIERFPKSSLVDDAHYWIGETYFQLKDYQMAILQFDIVRKKFPYGTAAAPSLYKEALCFEALGSKNESRLLLLEVIDQYPGTSAAHKAHKHLK